LAGRRRETQQRASGISGAGDQTSFLTGLSICVFTGVVGSAINLGFAFSGGIVHKALEYGATPVTSTYAVWLLVLGAGFIPNLLYCSYLLIRDRTWSLFHQSGWAFETLLGIAMGLLWLAGIIGYGIGATYVGKYGTSVGYALFIAAMILSSNVLGLLTGEWKGAGRGTLRLLGVGILLILVSVAVLNLGGLY